MCFTGTRKARPRVRSPASRWRGPYHDYTTTAHGIVPLDKRKPFWHLAAIIFTLEAGFVYIFLGFTLNEAGFTLPATTVILAVGAGFYIIYGAVAASLGNRTGQDTLSPFPVDLSGSPARSSCR